MVPAPGIRGRSRAVTHPGDQLRETVRFMAQNEGGILLYLDQEGRGNGIANKIRAYKLQSQGYDTYDADEVLGFDADQRRFAFAAVMLQKLGVSAVRVLTNNPEKIGALAKAGLEVISDHRVLGRPTAENVSYLAAKRDRAGHYSDLEGMDALRPDGSRLGVVHRVENFGAGDLIQVRADDGQGIISLPFTRRTVPTIDLERRRLVVEPPAELDWEPAP